VVFETESREGIHLEDAKRVDGQWRVAGDNGMPLVVTGKGETMQAARRQAYDRIDDVLLPNMYYRDDIGERWIEGDRLLAWGTLGPAGPQIYRVTRFHVWTGLTHT
jgi:phosphoribosylamine--glycine ligase